MILDQFVESAEVEHIIQGKNIVLFIALHVTD